MRNYDSLVFVSILFHPLCLRFKFQYTLTALNYTSMPLPDHPLTVQGGCNCGAIRYKVQIPALLDRPLHPLSDPKSKATEVHLPFIAIDHCNDCRKATGAIIPLWLCTPIKYVTASYTPCPSIPLNPSTTTATTLEDTKKTKETIWHPASDIFQPGPKSKATFLSFYKSSDPVTRSFCSCCGTNLAYYHSNTDQYGFPDMLDLVLGTVDREDLEGEAMAPERHLWWDCSFKWVRNFSRKGSGGLSVHGTYMVNRLKENV